MGDKTMKTLKVVCQICSEVIAIIDTAYFTQPLRGDMFQSPDPHHGMDAPFAAGLDWVEMRCPYGRAHRPFVREDEILTTTGLLKVPGVAPARPGETAVPSISDEEAERQVRERLKAPAPLIIGGDPPPPVEPLGVECPMCGKVFDTLQRMNAHKGGAHNPKAEARRKKLKR